jgi:chemotaxis protein CheX
MKAECVNPFLQALQDVFKLMLDVDIARKNISANSNADTEKQVVVEIKLIGDITGSVLFSFPQSTTLEMVKVMSGMEFNKVDSFVTSALGEMSNIISGNAVTYLSKANYHCDILPPRIEVADRANVGQPALKVPLHTALGDMWVSFILNEK